MSVNLSTALRTASEGLGALRAINIAPLRGEDSGVKTRGLDSNLQSSSMMGLVAVPLLGKAVGNANEIDANERGDQPFC